MKTVAQKIKIKGNHSEKQPSLPFKLLPPSTQSFTKTIRKSVPRKYFEVVESPQKLIDDFVVRFERSPFEKDVDKPVNQHFLFENGYLKSGKLDLLMKGDFLPLR